jgi:hypothetical protein
LEGAAEFVERPATPAIVAELAEHVDGALETGKRALVVIE